MEALSTEAFIRMERIILRNMRKFQGKPSSPGAAVFTVDE